MRRPTTPRRGLPFYGPLPLLALVIGVCIWAPIVERSARHMGS
jgi:hypothetical protein